MSATDYRAAATEHFKNWIETGNPDELRKCWASDQAADALESEVKT